MAMAAAALLFFLTAYVISSPSVILVALVPAAAAFYIVRKIKGSYAWVGALILWVTAALGILPLADHMYRNMFGFVLSDIVTTLALIILAIELKIDPMKHVHILRYIATWIGFIAIGGQIACGTITALIFTGLGAYELIMAAVSLAAYVIYIVMICKRTTKSWIFATIASSCFLISAFSLFHIIVFPFWATFITLELIARAKTKAEFAAEAAQAQAMAQYQNQQNQ